MPCLYPGSVISSLLFNAPSPSAGARIRACLVTIMTTHSPSYFSTPNLRSIKISIFGSGMKGKIFLYTVISVSVVSFLFSGCKEKKKKDKGQNVVVVHYMTEPRSLHPTNAADGSYMYVQEYLQRTLTRMDMRTNTHIPLLVTRLPEASRTGLDYTFELRPDVRWDDKAPLKPEDVIFTMKVIKCPLTANPFFKSLYQNLNDITIDPANPLRFTLHMKDIYYKNPFLMDDVYLMQKSKWDPQGVLDSIPIEAMDDEKFDPAKYEGLEAWMEKFNSGETGRDLNLANGLGPYKVTAWQSGSSVTLERKKDWWGANDTLVYNRAYPEKIIFKYFTDDASIALALKKGTIDVTTQISSSSLLKLREDKDFNEKYESGFVDQYNYNYVAMNMKPDGKTHKPFFTDKRVRLAMAYLVPVDETIATIAMGRATRQASFIQPVNKEYYNDTLKLIRTDVKKAADLLTEAGWVDSDGDNIRDKVINGKKVKFSFVYTYTANPVSKEAVLMTKESMYKAGVEMTPNPVDQGRWQQLAFSHDFDMIAGAWSATAVPDDPQELFHTSNWANNGANFTGFGNAETDKVIELSNRATDPLVRAFYLKKLQAMIYDEMPYIYTYAVKRKVVISKRFGNRAIFAERPGVMLNNLKLLEDE
jgi:peptide/nickel transport system substrate-binding protein